MNALFGKKEKELCSAIRREGATLDLIRSVVERWRPQQSVQTSSPLRAAIECGAPREIVEYLNGLYPDAVRDIGDWNRGLPLHLVNDKTPPECVRFLVDRYPEALAVRDWNGDLPLYRALEQKAGREVIQMLVEGRPESIEEFDPEEPRVGPRVLPVHVAAMTWDFQDLEVMRYLVERSPESVGEWTPPDWGRLESARGCLPLHLALRNFAHPSVVLFLLERRREAARERAGPFLPLHLAVKHTSVTAFEEVARSLLDAYPEALRDTDERGSTVFHWACSGEVALSRLKLLLRLVEYSPDALLAADAAGDLPIHVALWREGVEELENRADVLSKACPKSLLVANSKGLRPLHLAIAANSLPVVRMFEDRSPGLLREVADAGGNTPAHLVAACVQASPDLARFIVEAWPESLLAVNKNGDTPAHIAIHWGFISSTEKMKIFVEQCPESLRVANRRGQRPLFVAIARHHAEIARLIVANDPEAARHVDARGRTAVHLAASLEEGSAPDLVQFLAEEWPAALRMRDAKGNLPLTLAAANDSMNLNALFLLLKACPDVVVVGRERSAS
jgi:ankyrin repeat protein